MTRSAKIREWLAANGPASFAAIQSGLGLTRQQMKATVYQMVGTGILIADDSKPRRYSIGRAPQLVWGQVKPQSEKNAYNAARRRKGTRTQAQIVADAAAKREESYRLKRLAAEIKQNRQQNAAKDRRDAVRQGIAIKSDALASPSPMLGDAETVEEFQSRGGVIHVLARNEVSPASRFRFIGERA